MVRLFTLVAIALLVGCADPIESAKEAVKAQAVNKRDLLYRDLQTFPGKVVCGEFESATKWGESAGFKPFVVVDGVADVFPDEADLRIFCSDDPAAELQAQFGIGPMDKSNTSLRKIHADLGALAAALADYFNDYKYYPKNSDISGLQNLLKPRRGSQSENDAYMKEIPLDPWDNAYTYKTPRQNYNAKKVYELFTLGKDAAPGGSGENADIGTQHLKYLDHINKL